MQLRKYKDNEGEMCDTVDYNFSDLRWYVIIEVSLELHYIVLWWPYNNKKPLHLQNLIKDDTCFLLIIIPICSRSFIHCIIMITFKLTWQYSLDLIIK